MTEECLLNPNRNPNLTKDQIESYLMEYLSVQKVRKEGGGLFPHTSPCAERGSRINRMLTASNPQESH